MSFNPYSDPTNRQLHDAADQLRGIHDQLWELNQPPEVRAALQGERATKARAKGVGLRVVVGLAAAWVVVSLVFGRAGQHAFGSVLGVVWNVFNVLLVVGFFVGIGVALVRGARTVARFGRGE